MRRPEGNATPDVIARLDAELTELRAAIAIFFRSEPYPLQFEHDTQTGQYVLWFDLGDSPAPIPAAVSGIAERAVADLLDAHERGHGDPSSEWDALELVRGQLADLLEPVLVPGTSRLLVKNAALLQQEGPVCGPFRDQQIVARGVVHPPDAEIDDILVFDIAFKETGAAAGACGGRSFLDLANTLYEVVRQDRT